MQFLPQSRRRYSSSRNVPGGEERGETDAFAGYRLFVPDMYLNVDQIEKRRKHSSPCLLIKWNYPLPLHKVLTFWVDLLPGKITQWLFLQRKVQLSPVHLFPVTSKIKREGNKLRFKVCHSPSIRQEDISTTTSFRYSYHNPFRSSEV